MPQRTDNEVLTALKLAVRSDGNSKGAYINRVTQTEKVLIIADDGTSFEKEVTFTISWDSISEILALVRNRAGI